MTAPAFGFCQAKQIDREEARAKDHDGDSKPFGHPRERAGDRCRLGADQAGRDRGCGRGPGGPPPKGPPKGGASGAEALMYMKSSEGDPNKMLIAYSLIYMLPLSAKIPFNWRELTPVSVIALDQFVLWVNTQLPYKSVKEFADAAKAASPPLQIGGTGSRREDHVLTGFMEKKTGAKLAYLPY